MEYCIEARALKPSLRRQIDICSSHSQPMPVFDFVPVVADEVVYEPEFKGGSGFVDDFLIDDLLDFTESEPNELEEEKESLSDCSVELETDESGYSTVSDRCLDLEFDDAGLAVPQDDLADLEWVSRFVDDSMPVFPPSGKEVNYRKPSGGAGSLPVQLKQPYKNNEIKPVIPAKPRTKRQRVGRVWSACSSTGSESSLTTTSSSLSSSSVISTPVQFGFSQPGSKRHKIEPKSKSVRLGGGDVAVRKCSHCQVQKTPQWRAGPEGAKTLCNACGVRFKSGRLFPEYRPACSPTFIGDVHSNSHRKVLEMRRKKDAVGSYC